jgi:hypothetical protein
MTHYFERNIVEIRDEYTDFLCSVMSPNIYEGFDFMFKKSKDNLANAKNKSSNLNVFVFFINYLKGIKDLNQNQVDVIASRLKNKSNCSEWFDDLVRAVIKSNIILLTFNASGQQCDLVNKKYHETINVTKFIHSCFIESATLFLSLPELFSDDFSPKDAKTAKIKIFEIINIGIKNVIRKNLPMQDILREFLKNDYINKKEHIRQMLDEDEQKKKLLISSEESYSEPKQIQEEKVKDIESSEYDDEDGENFFDKNDLSEESKQLDGELKEISEKEEEEKEEEEKEEEEIEEKEEEKEEEKKVEEEKVEDIKPEEIFKQLGKGGKVNIVKIKK